MNYEAPHCKIFSTLLLPRLCSEHIQIKGLQPHPSLQISSPRTITNAFYTLVLELYWRRHTCPTEKHSISVGWTAVCQHPQKSRRFTLHNLALFPKLNISLKWNQIVSIKDFQNIVTRPLKDLKFPSVFPGMKVALECVCSQIVATVLVTTVSYCSMHTYRAICT